MSVAASTRADLGDFEITPRLLLITAIAVVIGVVGALVAFVLLRLIGLFTNLFFYQRLSTELVSPAGNTLDLLVIGVPVVGAILIGLMARYGSERIRGHGIPEAIEAILMNRSRVEARVAILKPLSSAVSIGSGGPFGAEGPIIMTGGAVGSLVGQLVHLTAMERRALLVAGAAAGMSATFDTPVAAALLAVELLLFEWRPRSLIPVALASATAAAVRPVLLGPGPLFPVAPHPAMLASTALIGCVVAGLLAGGVSALLTTAVYAAEDAFRRLPIHWMWWPAIGGAAIGIGGVLFPQALGVGYDTIGELLQGDVPRATIVGVLLVKSVIWAVALGSGTSGGVLAPLLMIGGALGGVEAIVLPPEGAGFWPLVSMAAVLGGTMRSPFTAIVFAIELTHDVNMLLPVALAVPVAYAFTALTMRRSILTEKVSRRGLHLSREYAVDPLELMFVRDVMRTALVVLPADARVEQLAGSLRDQHAGRGQRLYPLVDAGGRLVAVIAALELERALATAASSDRDRPLVEVAREAVVAHPDEPLRVVAYRMAQTGLTRFPVVTRGPESILVGMIRLRDLLHARARAFEEEMARERIIHPRLRFPARLRPRRAAPASVLGAELATAVTDTAVPHDAAVPPGET